MSCKTISATMLPIKSHLVKELDNKTYEYDTETAPNFSIKYSTDNDYKIMYCVAYRHPSLPEWILARWWWNDDGIWNADGIFPM